MNAVGIINILVALLQLAQAAGVNIQQISDSIARAHQEGRDLTDAEVQAFAKEAQSAIDAARKA